MDTRNIREFKTKFDGIICGFCIPYLSHNESVNLISDSYNLLNDNGLIYISFVEGNPNNSGYQVGSSGDRTYFYYHNLEKIKKHLFKSEFEELKVVKVEYKKSETEKEIHTIVTAKKKWIK